MVINHGDLSKTRIPNFHDGVGATVNSRSFWSSRTAVMVISFAEIFTDAGFQKYLIQHEFKLTESLYQATTVAFWSNLIMSVLIWLCIVIFADELARLVGNEGYGKCDSYSRFLYPVSSIFQYSDGSI